MTGVVLALSGAGAWFAGSWLVSPNRTPEVDPPLGAVSVSFTTRDGRRVNGWWFPHASPKGTWVLAHGIRANRQQMTKRARLANSLGFAALSFDFQAHGTSPGTQITLGFLESRDVRAAVAKARESAPGLPVWVVGVSLGGAAALLARPHTDAEDYADAFIVESVFPTIEQAIKNRLAERIPFGSLASPLLVWQIEPRLGVAPRWLKPAQAATRIRAPVLVMSGANDQRTTLADTHALFDAFQGPKHLVLFEQVGHVDLFDAAPARYRNAITTFARDLRAVPK